MAYEGLMSQIANPQMADIAGALDYRQKRLLDEQNRQRDEKMKELMAKAIPNLREGSVLQSMAKEDPERFVMFTKAMGIPIDQAGQIEQMSRDVRQISKLAAQDPQGAISFVDGLAAEREQMGLDTSKLRQWQQLAQQDFGKASRAISVLDQSMNSDLIQAEQMQERKMRLQEKGLALQERQIEAEMNSPARQYAGQLVNTSQGLMVFDPGTRSLVPATTEDGKPLMGAAYDPNIKQQLSEAGAAGAAIGKDTADAKVNVAKVEDNASLLRNKVSEVLKHPGREIATGMSSVLPVVPGTKQADFVNRLDQLQGDAFLQAFETLKGGGQITEVEGQKAQQAINRMNRGTSKEEFDAAAKDFLSVVDALEQRTKAKAGIKTESQGETPTEDYLSRRKRLLGM